MQSARQAWSRFRTGLFAVLLLGIFHTELPGTEITAEDLEQKSDLWPKFVHLRQPVPASQSGRMIPTSLRGILVRIEEGLVIADFGRNGLVKVPIAATDVQEQAARLRQSPSRAFGLLTDSLFNKFYRLDDGDPVQCGKDEFQGIRYLLFIYAEPTRDDFATFYEKLSSELGEGQLSAELRVLLIPTSTSHEDIYRGLLRAGYKWPVMFHYLSEGYRASLAHPLTVYPGLVLVDDNGRILDTWESRAGADPLETFLNSIADTIARDRASSN